MVQPLPTKALHLSCALILIAALVAIGYPSVQAQQVECTITGTDGPDTLTGTDGNDVICGLGGNDTIFGGNGNDTIDGGDGDDILEGGNHDDTIYGGNGDDRIDGGNGTDFLSGDDGNDELTGFHGDDTIDGGLGEDDVFGGNGNDIIDGGPGNDLIDGGNNHDVIAGGEGNDDIDGFNGNDQIDGGPGDDIVQGWNNNDIINGESGNDLLLGHNGNDTLIGGVGTDSAEGGFGYDICSAESTSGCEEEAEESIAATWNPDSIDLDLATGTTLVQQITLRVDGEVDQAQVVVSGDASQVATVIQPNDPFPLSPNVDYQFTLALSAESDLLEQIYIGSIQVVADGTPLDDAAILSIEVTPPKRSVEDFAAPSSDRIQLSDVGPSYIESELMVGIDSGASDPDAAVQQAATDIGGIVVGGFAELRVYQVRVPATGPAALRQVADSMMLDPDVEIAGLHYVGQGLTATPNDPGFDDWDEANPDGNNWALEYINAPTGWDLTTGDPSVKVAIVDNEIDLTHDDLAGNAGQHIGIRAGPSGQHGTQVAGVACAQGNNGIGMAGVAWDCDLNGVEFGFPVISAPDSVLTFNSPIEVASRMSVAAQIGAEVTNLSFALPFGECISDAIDPNLALQEVAIANFPFAQAIAEAQNQGRNVLWVLGAGNNNCDARFFAPAGLSTLFDNVITVGGIEESGQLSDSAFGPAVTVAAPMTNILTTHNDFFFFQDDLLLDNGTSFAAPQVTGLAALMLSVSPTASAAELRQCIVSSAEDLGASVPGHAFRVIDVPGALDCVAPSTSDLLINGSFETGDLTGWTVFDNPDIPGETFWQVTDSWPALDGQYAAEGITDTFGPDGIAQTVQVDPGWYEASAWFRDTQDTVDFRLEVLDDQGSLIASDPIIELLNDWQPLEVVFYTESPTVTFRLTYYDYFSEDTAFIVDDAQLLPADATTGVNLGFEEGDLTGWTVIEHSEAGGWYEVVSPGLFGSNHAFRIDTAASPTLGIQQTMLREPGECEVNVSANGEAGTTARLEVVDASNGTVWGTSEYTFTGNESGPIEVEVDPIGFLPEIYTVKLLYVQRSFETATVTFDAVSTPTCE